MILVIDHSLLIVSQASTRQRSTLFRFSATRPEGFLPKSPNSPQKPRPQPCPNAPALLWPIGTRVVESFHESASASQQRDATFRKDRKLKEDELGIDRQSL